MIEGSLVQLTEVLRRFHCILNTAWPKPGSSEMAGASVFIGTHLFNSLEEGLRQLQHHAYSISQTRYRKDILRFTEAFSVLFSAVSLQGRAVSSEKVDSAINLLYLASGVFYHKLAQITQETPTTETEPFDDLLAVCQWNGRARTIEQVFNSLVEEMRTTADTLK